MRPLHTLPSVAAVALAAAVLLSTALVPPSIGAGSSGGQQSRSLSWVASEALPASLLKPWADRAGFNGTQISQVRSSQIARGPMEVTVTLWPRDLGLFLRNGAPLSNVSQVAASYGRTPGEYSALEQYFERQGLSIAHVWPDRLSLSVDGDASAISRAFGTTIESGSYQGRPVLYPAEVPSIPDPYGSEVAAVSGLTSGFSQFVLPLSALTPFRPTPNAGDSSSAIRTSNFIYPPALHTAYEFDGLYNYSPSASYATGEGIALVLWGEGYAPSDLNTFFQSYYPPQFPPVRIASYPVDGAPQPSANAVNDPSGATQEMTLDLEWSGSEAPGASLDAVYAPDGPASNGYSPSDPSMETALNTAINLPGVAVVSMSFGTLDNTDPSFQSAFSVAFASAAARGITIVAASGDTGGMTKAGCGGTLDPQFPASSPDVLATGGTALVLALNAVGGVTGIASEPAWSGSGGGFSRAYAAPAWQEVGSAAAPIRADGHRGTPDVSAPSADNFLYYAGGPAGGKGTSFAAPVWAGLIASMDHVRGTPLGMVGPRLYAVGAGEETGASPPGLVDVTSGANCLGNAGPGWDTATGWGTPRGLSLFEALSFSFVNLHLSTPDGTLTPGASATVDVQVVNATSGAPIPNVPVSFSLSALSSVGLCLGTLAIGNATTNSAGNATVALPVPTCYFGTQAAIAATVSAAGFYGSNSTTLNVNLLGVSGSLYIIQAFPYNVIVFGVLIGIAITIGWALGRRKPARPRATASVPTGPAPPQGAYGPPRPAPPEPPPPAP